VNEARVWGRRVQLSVLAATAGAGALFAVAVPLEWWGVIVASLFLAFLAGLSSLWSP